jgi:Uma2 family endonuclease
MGQVTTLPRGRDFTPADLAAMPDDGNRYELIDGALIVTPSPRLPHQSVVGELYVVLRAGCPDDLRVYLAPLDVTLSSDTVTQPDLLVTTAGQATGEVHVGVPVLAVEVLSPSTRHIDLGLKRSRYEVAGCRSYWVIDPDGPTLRAWELEDGAYREVASVTGGDAVALRLPFPVRIVPSDLVR